MNASAVSSTSPTLGGVMGGGPTGLVTGGTDLLSLLQRPGSAGGGSGGGGGGGSGGGGGRGSESGGDVAPSPLGPYGTAGLLSLLQAGRGDRDTLGLLLGENLAATGLSLPSPELLHSAFASPWGAEPVAQEPAFTLPACYRLPSPSLRREHLQKFDVTTLMYMFYALPRDMLQAFAAQELYTREWRYHRDLKLWFKPEKADNKTLLVYFDTGAWERKTFAGPPPQGGWLSEEECKAPTR